MTTQTKKIMLEKLIKTIGSQCADVVNEKVDSEVEGLNLTDEQIEQVREVAFNLC